MRDHGGNLDHAIATYGGTRADWIDLSTGINPVPYPLPNLPPACWRTLPTASALAALCAAAQTCYGTRADVLPLPGAQAAIQLIPYLTPPRTARVLGPTYNEHAACLRAAGWTVEDVASPKDLSGADLAILVNPNNPDGRQTRPSELKRLAASCGQLIVDESFADPTPELSLAPMLSELPNTLVLRSFGKFYGLAGLRLGFALGQPSALAPLKSMAGPWPVSGPALEIGRRVLPDTDWAKTTTDRLLRDATKLDQLAERAQWRLVGGTPLFRLYETGSASTAQSHLATQHIWSRIFPWSNSLIRLGPPGSRDAWDRLTQALS